MSITWRRHLGTVAIAMVTALATANAPAIAHGVHALFAHKADKVDGLHAVKSSVSKKKRRGKLVATDPTTGRLPNNILKRAPNSNKLDGLDSLDFLRVGDPIDADTLGGRGPGEFVHQAGSGIWLVQGDVSGWRSKVGSGSMTSSPDFDETTFSSTSASGSATHFIVPQLPLAAYGYELEMAGIEICYDASTGHTVDNFKYTRTVNSGGISAPASEDLDVGNHADEACRFYVPSAQGLSAESTVALEVDSTWTASGAVLRLGRVTFMLRPTSTDATPLS